METINRNAPIGVFDSGLGGLSAVKALRQILPGEDIVYFGDTARVPYGAKNATTIMQYAKQDIAFLLSHNVKAVMAACGTVSSILPADTAFLNSLPVPYIGVVASAAATAAAATQNGKIGIIGTQATIASGSYQAFIKAINPRLATFSAACPLFVPLVENGHFAAEDKMAMLATEEYLAPILAQGVDTLVLGCTHYPLLANVIAGFMGAGVNLVNPGKTAAHALKELLEAQNLFCLTRKLGTTRYYVSDAPQKFAKLAGIFLEENAEGLHAEIVE